MVRQYAALMNSVKYAGTAPTDTYLLRGVSHKRKAYHADKAVPMSAWMKFLGIYLAEGTMLRKARTGEHREETL